MPASRNTKQRQAVRGAFERADRPLSAAEALDAAQHEVPTLGIATAYRAINQLVDEGELDTVELPGEPARYELPDKPHHHHFHCQTCGQVFCVPVKCSKLDATVPDGFTIQSHEVIFYGICPGCST